MRKRGTWAGAGAVAMGLAGAGLAADRHLGTRAFATTAAVAAAGAYLAGTFLPRTRIFGAPATVHTSADVFALTFDDGPDPRYTPEISRLLAERGHRATFFVLARSVRAHPRVAAAVFDDGHELACHGDDHRLLASASPGELRRQIAATENAVHQATGFLPEPLFRAPHGIRSPWLTRVVENYGYRVCAWDGAVFDTAEPGAEVIVARVERLLRPGAIVLLHDGDGSFAGGSRQQTVDALPAILDAAERRGLRSVPMSELLVWKRPSFSTHEPADRQMVDAIARPKRRQAARMRLAQSLPPTFPQHSAGVRAFSTALRCIERTDALLQIDHFSKGAWAAKCLQMRILRSRLHDIGCQRDRRLGVVFRLFRDNQNRLAAADGTNARAQSRCTALARLRGWSPVRTPTGEAQSRSVSGLRLGFGALWRALSRLFRA